MKIGQVTGGLASNHGRKQANEHWPGVDAVRHINQYGTPTSPLLEIACTPDRSDTLRDFFTKQSIEVCHAHMNPCIDPAVQENNETDKKKLEKTLKNHFVRVLLAWCVVQ